MLGTKMNAMLDDENMASCIAMPDFKLKSSLPVHPRPCAVLQGVEYVVMPGSA
jgi:hypothetical protein